MARKLRGSGCVREFARMESVLPACNRIHVRFIGHSHAALAHEPLSAGIPVGSGLERSSRARPSVSLKCPHEQFMARNLENQSRVRKHATVQLSRLFTSTAEKHQSALGPAPPHDHVWRSCQNIFGKSLWRHSCSEALRQRAQKCRSERLPRPKIGRLIFFSLNLMKGREGSGTISVDQHCVLQREISASSDPDLRLHVFPPAAGSPTVHSQASCRSSGWLPPWSYRLRRRYGTLAERSEGRAR